METGIAKAVKAKGSISALARSIGITRAAICQWERIPAGRVVEIERLTGVPRQELRPDLYEPAPDQSNAPAASSERLGAMK